MRGFRTGYNHWIKGLGGVLDIKLTTGYENSGQNELVDFELGIIYSEVYSNYHHVTVVDVE